LPLAPKIVDPIAHRCSVKFEESNPKKADVTEGQQIGVACDATP
jgi:hypothetical protein